MTSYSVLISALDYVAVSILEWLLCGRDLRIGNGEVERWRQNFGVQSK